MATQVIFNARDFDRQIAKALETVIQETLDSIVSTVIREARRMAPVKTGALRASIRASAAKVRVDPVTFRVESKVPAGAAAGVKLAAAKSFTGHAAIRAGTSPGNIIAGVLQAGSASVPYAARIEYGYGRRYSFLWPAVTGGKIAPRIGTSRRRRRHYGRQ